jgi:D-3-phosphoglycerate dehydrogenase
MSLTVGVVGHVTDTGINFLKEKGYEIRYHETPDYSWLEETYKTASGILIRGNRTYSPFELLQSAKNLKIVSCHGVGYSWDLLDDCNKLGIWLAITADANYTAVVEHSLALMLAISKNILIFDKNVRQGHWLVRETISSNDLDGKVLGLVGVGRIGREFAKRAAMCFNMKVAGYDAFLPCDKFPEVVNPVQNMDDVFRQADVVSLHIPYSPENDKIINMEKIRLMKKTAFLLNTARGGIINENDLFYALSTGMIRGAAIDVMAEEPPPDNHPFFKLDNLIITPHSATLSPESMDRMCLHAAMNIHVTLTTGKPLWPVNNLA